MNDGHGPAGHVWQDPIGDALVVSSELNLRCSVVRGDHSVGCLGSQTMGPLYTFRTTSRNGVTTEASNDSDGGNCTSIGPRFSAKPSV
jgi:hypothetical protein